MKEKQLEKDLNEVFLNWTKNWKVSANLKARGQNLEYQIAQDLTTECMKVIKEYIELF